MRIQLVLVGRTMPGFNELLTYVHKQFRAHVSLQFIDFPMTRAFRKERNQYEAEVLLHDLVRLTAPEADRTVFITREDIFSKPLNFVFGLAAGNSCIVSTARLDPRFYGELKDAAQASEAIALFHERLVKEVVHELGHTLGISHCDDKKCVMVFSNSIHDVDFKGKVFCENCDKLLGLMQK